MSIDLKGVNKSYRTRLGLTQILRNVDLHVDKGEHVGILGQNGSGKSTLIRILSGSEKPTSGVVHRGMSVSWPLAFGGAFVNALTGMDNIRFVCRLYGVDPKSKVPFVEDFTELGKYLREPVRSYSSGMRARLAFAISMAIDFDCYLIDEIAAVGDDRFQRKCQVELFEKRADKALLIVSHSPEFIRAHCNKASVLVAGELTSFDNVDDAYNFYTTHELAMQPHMQEAPAPEAVHLPENPVDIVADFYRQAGDAQKYRNSLESLRLDAVPVFDSCDLVGQLDRAGDTGAAKEMSLWLTERRPSEPLFWITLGDLYAKQRQHIPSVQAYQNGLRLDPKSYWGNRNLASELFNVGRYEDAIPIYEAAIAVAPSPDSKLELRLRWLDCNILSDHVTAANEAEYGIPLKPFTLVDKSGVMLSDGKSARLAIGGFSSPVTNAADLKCEFRIGDQAFPGYPTFARNSIRRLAHCSKTEAFAFVHYGPIGHLDGEVEFELSEKGERRLSGSLPVRRDEGSSTPEDVSFLEAARLANNEHRAEASALLYGASAQRGEEFDIVPFVESLIGVSLYDEAEHRLIDWMKTHERHHDDWPYVVDLTCQELARSRIPGWRRRIDRLLDAEARHGESISLLANQGHAKVADRELDEAIDLYRKASRLAAKVPLIHFARGIHTAKFFAEVPRYPAADLATQKANSSTEFVHLFACDANYFKLFAPVLVASSARNRGEVNVLIHAHIIDPDQESLELAEKLKAKFGLVFSAEDSPPTISDYSVRRAYFTCARFLVAPQLLREHGCPVLITEADCLLNWSWSTIKAYVVGADVGYLQSSMWNWVPWTKIPAGICLYAATDVGIKQAEYVADFIRYAFEREGGGGADLWTVDQVALWLAHVTRDQGSSVHLPMFSVLTLATGDKSNLASA